ncbi:hypothetical protein KIN20_010728 [Parelaphostrongylus tenuis]|uniref:Uncharacterized protein n=1 Tax=Parelaphostrongylus tenuis TaxID=148309 RepID=A0AAD5MBW7_PARTN|nr:hypothetical protein KIN20_010728 [Parelaphostrongylus tenuis]
MFRYLWISFSLRYLSETEGLRSTVKALEEEIRIMESARQRRREDIQEQTRRCLEPIGNPIPEPKPEIKDEFPRA